MYESKGLNVLAKPHPYILILTWMVAVLVVITHDKQGLAKWEPCRTDMTVFLAQCSLLQFAILLLHKLSVCYTTYTVDTGPPD